eukprot:10348-Heterococcus_DN1.PRE.1
MTEQVATSAKELEHMIGNPTELALALLQSDDTQRPLPRADKFGKVAAELGNAVYCTLRMQATRKAAGVKSLDHIKSEYLHTLPSIVCALYESVLVEALDNR